MKNRKSFYLQVFLLLLLPASQTQKNPFGSNSLWVWIGHMTCFVRWDVNEHDQGRAWNVLGSWVRPLVLCHHCYMSKEERHVRQTWSNPQQSQTQPSRAQISWTPANLHTHAQEINIDYRILLNFGVVCYAKELTDTGKNTYSYFSRLVNYLDTLNAQLWY